MSLLLAIANTCEIWKYFVAVVNLSPSMKIVDPINAIRSQYEYGTGYSTSFETEG